MIDGSKVKLCKEHEVQLTQAGVPGPFQRITMFFQLVMRKLLDPDRADEQLDAMGCAACVAGPEAVSEVITANAMAEEMERLGL